MSSGRKSIAFILFEAGPQNNPEVHDFLRRALARRATTQNRHARALVLLQSEGLSAAAELAAALRRAALRAARGGGAGTLVLVTEDQATFLEVIGRPLDCHPIARQLLDAVLLHLAGSVGHDLVAGIELHAVARVGEDFGDQSFELDQLFFSHGSSPDRLNG